MVLHALEPVETTAVRLAEQAVGLAQPLALKHAEVVAQDVLDAVADVQVIVLVVLALHPQHFNN